MKSDRLPTAPVASLEGVSFTYRDTNRPAVRDIDFALRPGEMVGIMGASGAGKSTLVKCLNRLVPGFEDGDFRGVARIDGKAISDTPVCELAPAVGMVFQDFEAQLFSTNVGLEVAFGLQQMGMPREEIVSRIGPVLEAVGLAGFESRDPTTLSGGEKQRLAIAAVLATRPRVIIFDEPTTDLDPEGRAEVLELIQSLRDQNLALVVIEHEAEALRACDRVIVMRDGAIIAEGLPAAIMTQLAELERCGIHPPDLNRAWASLGFAEHVESLNAAESQLRSLMVTDGTIVQLDPTGDIASSQPLPAAPLVAARELSFSYPKGSHALENLDLQIGGGEFVAIVGRNGSGKTTLAKLIAGLLNPVTGTILIGGRDRRELRSSESAQAIGYVFQNPDHQIFAATVEDEIAFGPNNFGLSREEVEERVAEVLQAVNLEAARDSDPFLLSKGERQRLAVASVLALRPRLLILDEPTTGLDYREQRRMMALVARLNRDGIAIVMITHTPWLVAEYARRVILLRQGRVLFDGDVRAFFEQERLLSESSFRPPEITLLARRLGFGALTVDEFVATVRASIAPSASRC